MMCLAQYKIQANYFNTWALKVGFDLMLLPRTSLGLGISTYKFVVSSVPPASSLPYLPTFPSGTQKLPAIVLRYLDYSVV